MSYEEIRMPEKPDERILEVSGLPLRSRIDAGS